MLLKPQQAWLVTHWPQLDGGEVGAPLTVETEYVTPQYPEHITYWLELGLPKLVGMGVLYVLPYTWEHEPYSGSLSTRTGGGGGVGSAGGGGSGSGGRNDNWRVYCERGEANELGIICETDCVEKHSHICTFSSCSCQFPKHWGLPCRHLFALYQKVRGREARARMRLCLRASVACTAPVHDVRDKHERAEPRSHCTTPHACEVDCCALDR